MSNIISFSDYKKRNPYQIPEYYLENVCKELDIASAVLIYYDPDKGIPVVDAYGVNEVGAELLIKMAYHDVKNRIEQLKNLQD